MDLQKTFDYVVEKVITQGGKASSGISCQYLTDDGRRCAAGHMMTDEQLAKVLSSNLNNRSIKTVINMLPADFLNWREPSTFNFILAMQAAHDNSTYSYEDQKWTNSEHGISQGFRNVSIEFDLDPSVVDRFPVVPVTNP